MHPVDSFLASMQPVEDSGVIAWLNPLEELDALVGPRVLRTLTRLDGTQAHVQICENLDAFLETHQTDDPEIGKAWTEPLEQWQRGMRTNLVPRAGLYFIHYRVLWDDGTATEARLEVVRLTQDRGLVELRSDFPFGEVPNVCGCISLDRAAESLALLISRMETELWTAFDLFTWLPRTNLPKRDFLRVALARDFPIDLLLQMSILDLTAAAQSHGFIEA